MASADFSLRRQAQQRNAGVALSGVRRANDDLPRTIAGPPARGQWSARPGAGLVSGSCSSTRVRFTRSAYASRTPCASLRSRDQVPGGLSPPSHRCRAHRKKKAPGPKPRGAQARSVTIPLWKRASSATPLDDRVLNLHIGVRVGEQLPEVHIHRRRVGSRLVEQTNGGPELRQRSLRSRERLGRLLYTAAWYTLKPCQKLSWLTIASSLGSSFAPAIPSIAYR